MKSWWEKEGAWFDCFLILGVSEDATKTEIKKKYRNFVKKNHPDSLNGDKELFLRGTLAYETLINAKSKEKYIEYTKKLKATKDNENKNEENISFEELVSEYKRREMQIKISVNAMIIKVEQKEERFRSVYENFCKVLKSKSISSDDFEIRRQKLRSLELSIISSIKEIEEIINRDLKNVNLKHEQKRLKDLREKFEAAEDILTSSYNLAVVKSKLPKIKIKKGILRDIFCYSPLAVTVIIVMFLMSMMGTDKEEHAAELDVEVLAELSDNESVGTGYGEKEDLEIKETLGSETETTENSLDVPAYEKINFDYRPDCILFQNIPGEEEYVTFSNSYTVCGREVVIADDQYGVSYLLDANDHSKVLFGNFISYGGPYNSEDGYYFCILSADGYDYKLDANDFRTIIDVESAYSKESEPFYLDGYGYVIEAMSCGEKYLIDAETRYAFIRNFDDYESMYYDEEFGCYVYCFNKYDENCKYYLAANNLKKVLKIEKFWE